MKPLTCCLFTFALMAASAAAYADGKFDATARAKAIAPFVEAETVLVAHVDLTRVDTSAALDFAARTTYPTPTPNEYTEAKKEAAKGLQGALQAGVKEFYVVVTLGKQGWQPKAFAVVPMPAGADAASFREALHLPAGAGRVADGSFVFNFPDDRWQPVDKFQPAARPELVTAFEAAGDSAVQVALIPPDYAPRVIEELIPQFPKELGGGPTTVLTRGISWASAGVDLPPHQALRLTIQSANAQAAEALRAKLAEMMRLIGEIKIVRETIPKYDEIAAALALKVEGDRLVLDLNEQNQGVEKFLSLVTPPIGAARDNARRVASTNNLKQIGLAMHNYYQANKHFPLPASMDKDGKPLLSWRVHILPFLDENDLYKKFHLDEPWDSPHNRSLIDKMPSCYRMPMSKSEQGRTNYLLPVGNGAVFEADKPTEFKDIVDGTSNTIMIVEVDDQHASIWTKPEDLPFDPKDPTRGLGRFFDGGFNASICDGSVRWMEWPKEPKDIHRLGCLIMRADREPVAW
jgi:hypothetical protein